MAIDQRVSELHPFVRWPSDVFGLHCASNDLSSAFPHPTLPEPAAELLGQREVLNKLAIQQSKTDQTDQTHVHIRSQ